MLESDDYDSPEIQNKKYMSPSFIIWQLGIICFEMMAGYHPFSNFIGTINQRKIS
jgi:serine/threonine protein kinase